MDEDILRVNCGSSEDVVDTLGRRWCADEGGACRVVGGGTVTREADLPIHSTHMAEVLRSERFGVDRYEFDVPAGRYSLEIYAAETFEGSARPKRAFDVHINGEPVATAFSPYTVAGGFARAAKIEAVCDDAHGRIAVSFSGDGRMVNAIAVSPYDGEPTTPRVVPAEEIRLSEPPSVDIQGRRSVRMLFIGNSGTFFWDIPQTAGCLVNQGQSQFCIETDALTSGGKTFRWHSERDAVRDAIASGRYDYVVLQDGSKGPTDQPEEMMTYGGRLIETARAAGSEPLLYAYYGPKDAPDSAWDQVADRYLALGEAHDVTVVPTCVALRRAMLERPDANYHNPDRHHSGMHAAYLIACSFFRVLTSDAALDHLYPAVLGDQVKVKQDMARFLARVANVACDHCGERAVLTRGPLLR